MKVQEGHSHSVAGPLSIKPAQPAD